MVVARLPLAKATTILATMLVLVLVLEVVLELAACYRTSDGSEESMTGFLATKVSRDAATYGSEKPSLALLCATRSRIWIIVWIVAVRVRWS